jgi:carbonic anhydrase
MPHYITLQQTVAAIVLSLVMVAVNGEAANWGYSGDSSPVHWGTLHHDFAPCALGRSQSPVDLDRTYKTALPELTFTYQDAPLQILNNGHTIEEVVAAHGQGRYPRHGPTVTAGAASGITIDGIWYALQQFHFHSPSEHTVQGKHYAMETHLVHQSMQGLIAVVAVFLTPGSPHAAIAQLWANLPADGEQERLVPQQSVNATALLPADRRYYRYYGSFTTPPCTEGVTWIVMKHPVAVAPEQIKHFQAALGFANNRPVQAQNFRFVLESE